MPLPFIAILHIKTYTAIKNENLLKLMTVVITCKGDSVQEKQPVVLKALTLMYLVGVTTCKNPTQFLKILSMCTPMNDVEVA